MSGYGFRIRIEPLPEHPVATPRTIHRAVKRLLVDALTDNAPPMFADWISERFITVGDESPDNPRYDDELDIEWDAVPREQELLFQVHAVGYWPDELGDHLLKLAACDFVALDATLRSLGYRRVVREADWNEPTLPRWSEAYFGSVERSRFATPLFMKLGDAPDETPTDAHAIVTPDGLAQYIAADGKAIEPTTPIAFAALTENERARFVDYIAKGCCACSWCLSHGVFSRWNARSIAAASGWEVRAIDELLHLLFLDDRVQLRWAVSAVARDGVASRFYRTRDAGLNWELLDQPEHERAYVLHVAHVRRGPRWVIYAAVSTAPRGAEDRWLCSLDGGETYRDETGPAMQSVFNALAFFPCPRRPERIAVAATDRDDRCRLYVSMDGGVRWTSSEVLVCLGGLVTDVSAVTFSPDDVKRLYAVVRTRAHAGVLVGSDDGGATWQVVESVPPGVRGIVVGSEAEVLGVLVHARDDGQARLLRSGDGGQTWRSVLALEDNDDTGALCTSGRGRWFCGTSDVGTYASDDDGATWNLVCPHVNGSFLADDPDDEHAAFFIQSGVLVRVRSVPV